MTEFLHLVSPQTAIENIITQFPSLSLTEIIATSKAFNRVTAISILAHHSLPIFQRSAMDGYALCAKDTYGTTDTIPSFFQVIGEVLMGTEPTFTIEKGQSAIIHTGGMIPKGADAVVMVENTQQIRANEIEILRAISVGENVIQIGEDVTQGEEIITSGKHLRTGEIGGLMALGITRIQVIRQPKIGIISTGDEVIPPDQLIKIGQVRDVNTYTISTLVMQNGGIPVSYGIIPDQKEVLQETATRALEECDAVAIIAGSSASVRDLTADVINNLGQPGVLVHGINIRPGKPTILGICNNKPVLGLPGNPVSAYVIAELFLTPIMNRLLGVKYFPRPPIRTVLTVNIASQAGREDWIPARLIATEDGYQTEPIFFKSNLIFTLTKADGLIRIPQSMTGCIAGKEVEFFLLR